MVAVLLGYALLAAGAYVTFWLATDDAPALSTFIVLGVPALFMVGWIIYVHRERRRRT